MKANEYSAALARLPFGKKLPDAVYVYWVEAVLPEPLRSLVGERTPEPCVLRSSLGYQPPINASSRAVVELV